VARQQFFINTITSRLGQAEPRPAEQARLVGPLISLRRVQAELQQVEARVLNGLRIIQKPVVVERRRVVLRMS